VTSADAYVFVTPEYNYRPPPALLNALDYVYKEWNYKPAGIVSYGGISGDVRAIQMEKLTLTALKIMPVLESVVIQNVSSYFDDQENFLPEDKHKSAGSALLNELHKWALALKTMKRP
jgi:NAD(P)H-dependent FMN reductase